MFSELSEKRTTVNTMCALHHNTKIMESGKSKTVENRLHAVCTGIHNSSGTINLCYKLQ